MYMYVYIYIKLMTCRREGGRESVRAVESETDGQRSLKTALEDHLILHATSREKRKLADCCGRGVTKW